MGKWIRFKWLCFKCWMQFDDAFYQEWYRLVEIAFPNDLDHRRYSEGSCLANFLAEEIMSLRAQNERLKAEVTSINEHGLPPTPLAPHDLSV